MSVEPINLSIALSNNNERTRPVVEGRFQPHGECPASMCDVRVVFVRDLIHRVVYREVEYDK
jgi:hypothetical protein